VEACRTLNTILMYISRTKQYHSRCVYNPPNAPLDVRWEAAGVRLLQLERGRFGAAD
jgi:hypothetical protein